MRKTWAAEGVRRKKKRRKEMGRGNLVRLLETLQGCSGKDYNIGNWFYMSRLLMSQLKE